MNKKYRKKRSWLTVMGVLLSCGDFYPIFVDVILEKSDFLESVRRENDFVFASFLIKIPENIILEFLSGDCQIICFDSYKLILRNEQLFGKQIVLGKFLVKHFLEFDLEQNNMPENLSF